VALPLVLIALVALHILALHEVGSNNTDGVDIKKHKDANGIPMDGIPFHPYYTVKDLWGVGVFLVLFAIVVFYAPEFGGWFLESANFVPANPLQTPDHILPVWYFTPYYAILRAIPDKLTGVIAMFAAVLIFFVVPWLDRHPVKSVRYRSKLFRLLLIVFAVTFLVLGWLGVEAPTPGKSELGLRLGELYFAFFLMLWVYSKERTAAFSYGLFLALVVLLMIFDSIRYDASKQALMMWSALLPLGYFIVFLLLPVHTRLNESRAVPERVTS